MGTIVWIFHNVMPWLGVMFTLLVLIYFVLEIIKALTRDKRKSYSGVWDFVTVETGGASMVVNFVGVLIAAAVGFLIQKIEDLIIDISLIPFCTRLRWSKR